MHLTELLKRDKVTCSKDFYNKGQVITEGVTETAIY